MDLRLLGQQAHRGLPEEFPFDFGSGNRGLDVPVWSFKCLTKQLVVEGEVR